MRKGLTMFCQLVLEISPLLTSSAEDSPARISPMPGRARASRAHVPAFGSSTLESFASYDPASSSWKTSQRSLLEEWTPFSETWPKQGTMQSGVAFAPVTLAPRTDESGCSSWPTPRSCSAAAALITATASAKACERFPNLESVVAIIEGRNAVGKALNPAWVSQLQGFPPGWTDGLPAPEKPRKIGKPRESATPAKARRAVSAKPASKHSATRSSRKSRAKSGGG